MRGSWGWPTESPGEFRGKTPVRDPGYFIPRKRKEILRIYFNVLCIKNIQDFIRKGVELMVVNWVQSSRWNQTQLYTEFNVNVWHV